MSHLDMMSGTTVVIFWLWEAVGWGPNLYLRMAEQEDGRTLGPRWHQWIIKTTSPQSLHLRTSVHTGEPNSSLFKATDLGFLILAAESPTMALVTKIKSRPLWGRWGRRGGRIFVRTSHCVIMTINQTQNCKQNIKVLRNTHTSKIIKIQKWSW